MSEMAPIPTEFCAPQRKSLSAINRHNRRLFDHLGGAQQNRWGYGKIERVGGLAVHDHLEPGRELHREIARLLAAQDAIHIGGGTTKGVYHVGSVGEQSALSGKGRLVSDRRYVFSGRRQYDRRPKRADESSPTDDKTTSRLASKVPDGLFDLHVAMNGRSAQHDPERPGRRLK